MNDENGDDIEYITPRRWVMCKSWRLDAIMFATWTEVVGRSFNLYFQRSSWVLGSIWPEVCPPHSSSSPPPSKDQTLTPSPPQLMGPFFLRRGIFQPQTSKFSQITVKMLLLILKIVEPLQHFNQNWKSPSFYRKQKRSIIKFKYAERWI